MAHWSGNTQAWIEGWIDIWTLRKLIADGQIPLLYSEDEYTIWIEPNNTDFNTENYESKDISIIDSKKY